MYLVTGGAGFIGSNLVHALVARGQRVRVLDNLATGRLDNLEPVRGTIEFVQGDIRSLETCQKALHGIRFVLHQAALPSVPRSFEDPISSSAVNIHGTLNLLIAARDHKIERFVYASSSSVYGDTPTLPKVETMTLDPLCGEQAHRRAVLPGLRARLQAADRLSALLQRVWPQAGPDVHLCSGDPALHQALPQENLSHHLRRWHAISRFHLC